MTAKCPNCKKDIDTINSNLEYDKKHGRRGTCPECGKPFYLHRNPAGYKRTATGQLVRTRR